MMETIFYVLAHIVFFFNIKYLVERGIEEEQKIAKKRWEEKEFSYREAQLLREAGYPV